MAITPLPTPVPSTADPANFDVRADAFLGALPLFADEANLLAIDVNNLAVAADADAAAAAASADAALISATQAALQPTTPATRAGNITFPATSLPADTTFSIDQTNKTFVVGQWVSVSRTSDPASQWLIGAIKAFTMGTGGMTVTVTALTGLTGSQAGPWTVSAASPTIVIQPVGSILYINDAFGIF